MEANVKREQIAELIHRVRKQDGQAFSQLLDRYQPLINARVSHYAAGDFASDADDFRQEANVALHHAALTFRLDQTGVEFGLYAKICIENALVSHLRRLIRNKQLEQHSEMESTVEDSPEDWLKNKEAYAALLARIQALLSPFENRVWNMVMVGFKPKEIAQVLGKESRSIENAVYRIRCKLKSGLQ